MKNAILVLTMIIGSAATAKTSIVCEDLNAGTNPGQFEAYYLGGTATRPKRVELVQVKGSHPISIGEFKCKSKKVKPTIGADNTDLLMQCDNRKTGFFLLIEEGGYAGGQRVRVLDNSSEQDATLRALLYCTAKLSNGNLGDPQGAYCDFQRARGISDPNCQ